MKKTAALLQSNKMRNAYRKKYLTLLRRNLKLKTTRKRKVTLNTQTGLTKRINKIFNSDQIRFLNGNEMKIDKGSDFDCGLDRFLGYITLPYLDDVLACSGLVFNIGGISSRWKQILGYHYSGLGTTGAHVHDIILEIITKCEEIGLRIHSVTCDMGSMNIQMWNAFNVAHFKSDICGQIEHPIDPYRQLYFFADVPH